MSDPEPKPVRAHLDPAHPDLRAFQRYLSHEKRASPRTVDGEDSTLTIESAIASRDSKSSAAVIQTQIFMVAVADCD